MKELQYDSRQLSAPYRDSGQKTPIIMIWYYSISGCMFSIYLNIMKVFFAFKSQLSQGGGSPNLASPNWRESYIKFFLRSATKSPKLDDQTFFWPTEKQKTLGPKSSAIWDLWRHLNLICTHQAHQISPKTSLVDVKMRFWRFLVCLVGANKF